MHFDPVDYAVLAVAILHIVFMLAESMAWPFLARRLLGVPSEIGEATAPVGLNQGLYNGFLAAGLLIALFAGFGGAPTLLLTVFLLACVVIAGVIGALSLRRPLFLLFQSVPAVVALLFVFRVLGGA